MAEKVLLHISEEECGGREALEVMRRLARMKAKLIKWERCKALKNILQNDNDKALPNESFEMMIVLISELMLIAKYRLAGENSADSRAQFIEIPPNLADISSHLSCNF